MSTDSSIPTSRLIILLILIAGLSAAFIAYGAITGSFTFNNVGYIRAIGVDVYFDPECTNQTTTINWGYLQPGESKNITVYIKNNGTVAMVLSHTVQNWSPASAENYITFSWDGDGKTVEAGEVTPVTLTISVAENIEGITTFSFEIVIIGSEVQS